MAASGQKSRMRRYTNLAGAIHILHHNALTLLNPSTWDDKNDVYFIRKYREKLERPTVQALCFAQSSETYHHWKVFAPGSDGVALEFDRDMLVAAANTIKGVRTGEVEYYDINTANEDIDDLSVENLPFIKRSVFKDEKEFRIIYESEKVGVDPQKIDLPPGCLLNMRLSPWMHPDLVEPTKAVLRQIGEHQKLKIYRSTLIENELWKKIADEVTLQKVRRRRSMR